MFEATTLTEILEANRRFPRSITYLDGENCQRNVPFAELHARAYGILYHLQRLGAGRGDKLILFLGDNELFIDAFWAAVLGGIIPVPVTLGNSHEHHHKLLRIARMLHDPYIYTDRKALDRIGEFAAGTVEAQTFQRLRSRAFLVDDLEDISRPGNAYRAQPHDVALIQFSSGSTSEPKGVVLTHGNIVTNALGVAQAAQFCEDDVSLSWMPLAHDMGLIGFHVFMFANRIHSHLMPTELFVRRPLLWLGLATRIRATILCSPNFGYRHYLKVLAERPIDGLDLSSVRLIFNGAEPISVELCEQFLTRLAPARLARNAMFPVYGLAEASLAVSFPQPRARCKSISLNRHRLGVGDRAAQMADTDRDGIGLMSVGRAIPYCRVRIAGDNDQPLPDEQIGHIQISGENVTEGYYENPAANVGAFTADGWLRTGDLGVIRDGELYISGRAKEIVFVNGQNYYPHDLENIAQRVEGLELCRVAAAGIRPRGGQADQLIFFVVHRGNVRDFLPVAEQVTGIIGEQTGLAVDEVVPVKHIPKTTSGKIQRHLLEARYLEGEFDDILAELRGCRATLRRAASTSPQEIEDKLKRICENALAGRPVGIYDNLFEFGLSSLKFIELHREIDRQYPGDVEIGEMFDCPTIADLARHLESKLATRF